MGSKLDENKESAWLVQLRQEVTTAEQAFKEKQGGILKFLDKISNDTNDTQVQARIKDLVSHIEDGLALPLII